MENSPPKDIFFRANLTNLHNKIRLVFAPIIYHNLLFYALQLQGKAEGEKQIKILQTKLKYLNYCATPGDEFCHHMVEIDAQNTAAKWLIAIKINAKHSCYSNI